MRIHILCTELLLLADHAPEDGESFDVIAADFHSKIMPGEFMGCRKDPSIDLTHMTQALLIGSIPISTPILPPTATLSQSSPTCTPPLLATQAST